MTRPMRSLLIGDCDHYFSPYIFGVAQTMGRLGVWHSQVSIRAPLDVIAQRLKDVRPDVLWTHMLLWAPQGSPKVDVLVALMEKATRGGAKVVIHDGDYKGPTRHPADLSSWCAVALCNHRFDRSAWNVPILHWPYFAFIQDHIADADDAYRCPLWFAGTVGAGPVYAARTALLDAIKGAGVKLRMPAERDGNTLFRTPAIAASADAVLGFGRPGVQGWVDTRVFQYPGAGAVLLHDDPVGFLEPWEHYVPYRSGDAGSVVEALAELGAMAEAQRMGLRNRAFRFVQQRHSALARVRQVLDTLGLRP